MRIWEKVALLATLTILSQLFTISSATSNLPSRSPSLNPYNILGVTKNATQEEIKKRYRKLCLEYHPDKHVNETPQQREKCETVFKQVQDAHAQIGDVTSRREYDSRDIVRRRYGTESTRASAYGGMANDIFDEIYQESLRRRMNQRRFYVNGVDISQLFRGGPMSHGSLSSNMPGSKYIEKVTIALEDLYSGVSRKEFVLHDTWIKRYTAAFRGGIAGQLAVRMLFR